MRTCLIFLFYFFCAVGGLRLWIMANSNWPRQDTTRLGTYVADTLITVILAVWVAIILWVK